MDPLTLLNPSDPNPVRETVAGRDSPFVLIGDHAGAAIPRALGDLGLSSGDRGRHIAVDIGIEELGEALAERLGTVFVRQTYSRLVVDCNRSPQQPGWIVEASDGTPVPGNWDLAPAEREARRTEVYEPYHRAIEAEFDRRASEGRGSVLVALHSFTPVMLAERRPWELGVLHDGHEDGFALAVLEILRERGDFTVGDNQPYMMNGTDYTVPRHAFARGLPYLEIEVRQDLLQTAAGVGRIVHVLAETLETAWTCG